ncbi:MAG: fimbrillin family protein, partial [Prevotella sp.]|nr:fimbrillin family protein [Prevotella sp.]
MTLKNLHSIFAAALMGLLASCSSDSVLTDSGVGNEGEEEYIGVTASIPALEFEDTRSSLTFNSTSFKFTWEVGDQIRVFPKAKEGLVFGADDAPGVLLTYIPGSATETSGTTVRGQFGTEGGERYILNNEGVSDYLTVSPEKSGTPNNEFDTPETGYNQIPVSYAGQVQKTNVELGYKGVDNEKYLASEKEACAHLGAYDYLYGEATQATDGSTHFEFKHLQATVRFLMKVPEHAHNQIFDKIMLYNTNDVNGRKFTENGKLDLYNTEMEG